MKRLVFKQKKDSLTGLPLSKQTNNSYDDTNIQKFSIHRISEYLVIMFTDYLTA